MDIERGIIKGLFYDYPIEAAVAVLGKRKDFVKDEFLNVLPEVMRWRVPEYTTTETDMMTQQLKDEYKGLIPSIHHLFKTLHKDDAEQLLTLDYQDHRNPIVVFDKLFRWKDITTFVGEDLLTTAFVAHKDLEDSKLREVFLWDDILHHNSELLNDVLDKGLSDLHAHWNATSDVFHLNWISLMNKIDIHGFDKLHTSQDIDLMSTFTGKKCSMRQLCVAAAYLRYAFYALLLQPCKLLHDSVKVHKAIDILKDDAAALFEISNLQASISTALIASLPSTDGRHVDYCIIPSEEVLENKGDANMLYQGERALLYTFFKKYYTKDNECVALAPYFYLYLLLKTRIRREFVQINSLKGFKNFQTYQDRKGILLKEHSVLSDNYAVIALQTSLDKKQRGYIEGRVSPTRTKDICQANYSHSLFGGNDAFTSRSNGILRPDKKVGATAHFIKEGYEKLRKDLSLEEDGICRYKRYRLKCQKQIMKLLKQYDSQQQWGTNNKPYFVGIDAASTEMFCRPEVYGHIFRYAKTRGLNGRTYHVGEDFLDLTDGLRAIDEAILFLNLGKGNRIGHALALGIDAKKYYEKRHYKTILSKQDLLDDCVWTYMHAHELNVSMTTNFATDLTEKALQLYNEIGYQQTWSIQNYWHSMLLRGDDPLCDVERCIDPAKRIAQTQWEQTSHVYDKRMEVVYSDKTAVEINKEYQFFQGIKHNGVEMVKYEWDPEIVQVIEQLQDAMRKEIAERQIGIECNPTSNLKIGYIDLYQNHPLLTKFHPIQADSKYPSLLTSINTDDRGVFHTSAYEEYSLIALALKKRREDKNENSLADKECRSFNYKEIVDYIADIQHISEQQRFDQKSRTM